MNRIDDLRIRDDRAEGTFTSALKRQSRVIGALIIRDLRTRVQGGYVAYSIAILWPMAHFGIILTVYLIIGRTASYGSDLMLWIATGALPFIAFTYPSRFISSAISENKALMTFPAVKSIDLMIARSIVECLTSIVVFSALCGVLLALEPNLKVYNPGLVLIAILEAIFVATGVGMLGFSVVRIWPKLFVAVIFLTILIWATMGLFWVPDSVPEPYRSYLAINPLLHVAEKMRMAVYSDYNSSVMSDQYALFFSGISATLGLFIDRFVGPQFSK